MRARLEATGQDPIWLVGNPFVTTRGNGGGGGAMTENWGITREQQIERGAGWEQKLYLDRGNQGVALDLSDRHEFEDAIARLDFIARLAPMNEADALHAWEGTVYLRLDRADDTWKERALPDAVLSLGALMPEGETGLRLTYRIQGPGLAPESEAVTGTYEWLISAEGEPLMDVENFYLAGGEHDD